MMFLEEMKKRGVPEIADCAADEWKTLREQYKQLLCEEEYGMPVPEPEKEWFEEIPLDKSAKRFCANKACKQTVIAHTVVCGKEFSFPFFALTPYTEGKHPFFVYNDFERGLPTKYACAEEIIDNGFALLKLCYEDVTSDDGDFTNGLAGIVIKDPAKRTPTESGKIMMWAWANMRVMDYAMTRTDLDFEHSVVTGHSRLGKTALVTGMLDERFRYVASNDAGCSGDAITRGKEGEQISDITNRLPYWFCENYKQYTDHAKLPFDQHMLLAMTAPRVLMIGAASEDSWADPASQYLSCFAASKVWENLGVAGLIGDDRAPEIGDDFRAGNVRYHLRAYGHYYSRFDWNVYMDSVREDIKAGK